MNYGQRFVTFTGERDQDHPQEKALVIVSTLFQQHKRRLCTWISPMVGTKIRLIIFLQPKIEKLYTVSKNKTGS